MLKKAVLSFCGLFVLSAGLSLGATLPIYCYMDYYVSTQDASLSATPRDRVCPVKVIFSDGGGGTTGRTYSCVIPAGQFSCSITVDPAASWVPAGFAPQSAYTASLYSATEEAAGCVYDPDYPSASVDTMMGMMPPQVNVGHRFDCTSRP